MPLTYAIDKKLDLVETLKTQNELFGEYIVGLMDHDKAINKTRDKQLKDILIRNSIACIALSKTLYLDSQDYEELIKCI